MLRTNQSQSSLYFLSDPANQGEVRGEILQPANRPHRVIRDLGPLTRAARIWAAYGLADGGRVRYRYESLADSQTLYLVADLVPGHKISGGKVLSSKRRRSSNRAATVLRLAAVNVGKTQTALGAFYRRLAARVGKAKAVTATARKLAVLFYNTLRYGMAYQDQGVAYYEEQHRKRVLKRLRQRAKELGFQLTAVGAASGVS